MKKLLIVIAILLPVAVFAQKSPVDKLFDKYANKDGFTTVNISGKLLGFASSLDTGDPNTQKMLSDLKSIRVLSVDDDKLNDKIDFYHELNSDGFFKKNDYEVLMEVTEKDQVVHFLARSEKNGKISDLLLIVGGEDNALISIRGLIDPENIGKITGAMDIKY